MNIASTLENFHADLKAIQLKAQATVGRSQAILRRAEGGKRDLTPDEDRQLESLDRQFTALESEADAFRAAIADLESEPQPRIAGPNPIASRGPVQGTQPTPGTVGAIGIGCRYSAMFGAPAASREFDNLGAFAKAVYERNPRLFRADASGMNEGVGADGGFYVPTQFYAGIMDNSLSQEVVRPGATVVPMTSASVAIPMFDTSNRSTGIANLEGKKTGEGATAATQMPKVRQITLNARKVSVLVPTTIELLQDAPQLFGGLLQTAMTDALAQTLDTWFINGTGAGAPLGVMNASVLVSVAKDVGQVNYTLTPTNIAGMVSRLAPGSWARSQWIVSPSALAQLFTLTTVVKNVAGSENVGGHAPEFFSVLPNGQFSLLGRPLVVSDRCQALGAKGDILLADLSQYLVGIRQNAELAVDTSIGFKESEVWFRLNCRVDGQPAQAAAITPRVGSASLSPFVTLDARS